MLSGLLCLLLTNSILAESCDENAPFKDAGPQVDTSKGPVIGKYVKALESNVAEFLGIPFAKPPVNEKRFAPPEPVDPWEKPIFATVKPTTCMQSSIKNVKQFPWIPAKGKRSEDCLYLNVWSPTKSGRGISDKLPVMVWIHPGGFSAGSSSMDLYDGSVLAAYGDVVVVSFNYRVGIFGFLNGGTADAPGNAGFYDQILVLKWVQENIENFGGNPDSVTVFGDSAGSISISLHLISPLSKNLFKNAIMMSGTGYQPYLVDSPAVAFFKTNTFAENIGCANKTVNVMTDAAEVVRCFKDKGAFELSRVESLFVSKLPTFFSPSYGNEVFNKSLIDYVDSGEISQVDVLIGNVKDESTIFLSYNMPRVFPMKDTPRISFDQTEKILSDLLPLITIPTHEQILEFYFQNKTDVDSDTIVKHISEFYSDFVFKCPTMFFAEKLNSARMYYNTHRSQKENKPEWMGMSHFFDVPYIFGQPLVDNQNFSTEDKQFSQDLMQKWVAFVRHGNHLSSVSDDSWPLFTSSDYMVHELNPKSKANFQFPSKVSCEFWRPFFRPPPEQNATTQSSSMKS